jgi:polyphosphate kinase
LQQKRITAARRPFHPSHFLNRELSWLEFNQRVLGEAADPKNPLLERLKFFCIVSSNLDEFFEIRVAGLKQQMESDAVERSVDGLTATETFRATTRRIRQMIEDQYACWKNELIPALARQRIRLLTMEEVSENARDWLGDYYYNEVRPVLTPMAIDPAHPFPQLLNKSLNMIVQLDLPVGGRVVRNLAVVQVPRVLPRVVKLPSDEPRQEYIMLGHLIGHYLGDLFPAAKILGSGIFG